MKPGHPAGIDTSTIEDPGTITAEIKMMRSEYPGAFLVVEGANVPFRILED